MDESKRKKIDAQKSFMLYGVMLITLGYAIGCIKHLIRLKQWQTLTFAGIEDVAIVVLIVILWPYRHPDRDLQVRQPATLGIGGILLIGVISAVAMGVWR